MPLFEGVDLHKDCYRVQFEEGLMNLFNSCFNEEYHHLVDKIRPSNIPLETLRKNAMATVRWQLGNVNASGTFHFSDNELVIQSNKQHFKEGYMLFQKELLYPHQVPLDSVEEHMKKAVTNMIKNASFCVILGG